jgi:hypothetical protein
MQAPAWLKIDEATGLLTGTPVAPGKVQVVVAARLQREVEELDLDALAWGLRQVTGVTAEKMGPAIQRFVIEVRQ